MDFVEEDRVIFGGATRSVASWGLDRIDSSKAELNQRFNLSCNLSGKGVDVYVLDTGINYDHKEFSAKVRYASESIYMHTNYPVIIHARLIANGHMSWHNVTIG